MTDVTSRGMSRAGAPSSRQPIILMVHANLPNECVGWLGLLLAWTQVAHETDHAVLQDHSFVDDAAPPLGELYAHN